MIPFSNHTTHNGYELRSVLAEKLATAPASPIAGRFYYDTVLNQQGYYNGTSWIYLSAGVSNAVTKASNATAANVIQVSGAADKTLQDFTSLGGILKVSATGVASVATVGTDYVTAASTNTFTNKTYDAAGTGNVLSNLATSMFATNVIDIDVALTANSDTRLASQKAVKAYVDNKVTAAVTGLYDDRGNYDASAGTFPTTGGSGTAGAILKGDIWRISVAGTISGVAYQIGDTLRALIDTPGATAANWDGLNANIGSATTTVEGAVILATVAETDAKVSTTKAVVPADLVNYSRKFVATIGDGVATAILVTHNLNTKDINVSLRATTGDQIWVYDCIATSVNTATFTFGTAPATNAFAVIIVG
jgi:hypothetical protein